MSQKRRIIANVALSVLATAVIIGIYYRDRFPIKLASAQHEKVPLWTKEAPKSFHQLSPDQLKLSLQNGEQVAVLDLRSRVEFANAHIPDAKNIPLDELEARMFDEVPAWKTVVLYCECPTEASSNMAYRILLEGGYKPAILVGGLESWKARGYEVRTAGKPIEW